MEVDLVKRVVADGDPLSFSLLVKMHQSAIRNFIRRLTAGDLELADDLSQNTFMKAYRNIGSYSGKGKFVSWLLQIAYREFVDEVRRNTKHQNQVTLNEELLNEQSNYDWDRQANAISLNRAMLNLSPIEQAILSLNYAEGLTHEEISQLMELPVGTVKTKIARAKLKLKSMLSDKVELSQEIKL